MTDPTAPDEPSASAPDAATSALPQDPPQVPPQSQPQAQPQPAASAAVPPSYVSAPPYTAAPGYVGGPQWMASPFAPVVKQPWFNPAKRTNILISAIVAGIVLLGGGVLIGLAAHHDGRHGRMFGPAGARMFEPDNRPAPRFRFPGNGVPGNGNGNGQPKAPPNASNVPSSAPSTGTTS